MTIGRMFSDTSAGFRPSNAPGFIAAQLVGAVLAYGLIRFLFPSLDATTAVVPHSTEATP